MDSIGLVNLSRMTPHLSIKLAREFLGMVRVDFENLQELRAEQGSINSFYTLAVVHHDLNPAMRCIQLHPAAFYDMLEIDDAVEIWELIGFGDYVSRAAKQSLIR